MDEKFVIGLLKYKEETDWIDFKRKLKLYDANGKLNQRERDELLKDILGLANGNSSIVRKTKYLVIGADDEQFDVGGTRTIFDVNYRIPSKSQITKWINDSCSPSVVGIDCHLVPTNGERVYVISIPPTFELHETTRELIAKGKFSKFTVFMRQDEHTVPASVKDGVTIQELKHLHRQEVLNPSAILFGAFLGAGIAVIFWSLGYNATKITNKTVEFFAKIPAMFIGGGLGAEAGLIFREWNSVRYDWRYYSRKKKFRLVLGFIASIGVVILLWLLTKM